MHNSLQIPKVWQNCQQLKTSSEQEALASRHSMC